MLCSPYADDKPGIPVGLFRISQREKLCKTHSLTFVPRVGRKKLLPLCLYSKYEATASSLLAQKRMKTATLALFKGSKISKAH